MSRELLSAMPCEVLYKEWTYYRWKEAETELLLMQKSLTKAAVAKNAKLCVELQKEIVESESAKMLAVRKVAGSKCSPGTDGIVWRTSDEKFAAAMSLSAENYHAKPYRHIIVETKNGKKRHVNIPTYYDRAMQVLYSFALDPIEEAIGERKSFAFRQGRSAQDANEYVKEALERENVDFVVLTDVKSCYESISHKWLLDNIPMDKQVLKEFLNAGFVFNGELFPSDNYGISIGCNISPILGNMTLDGMQKHIFRGLYGNNKPNYAIGNLVRFADDILVTVDVKETGDKVLDILSDFMFERGLTLSDEKTKIVSVDDGFDFLSRHYQRVNGSIIVTPSEASVAHIENELQDLILSHRGSQKSLIEKVNHKLTGWATYHKVSNAFDAFRHIDVFVKATLLRACEIRHPKWSVDKILKKYWYLDYDGQYVYALKDKTDVRVKRISSTIIIEHNKIKTNLNAYLDTDYLEKRADEHEIYSVTGKYRPVWNRQRGHCYYCGKQILSDQNKAVIQINPSRGKKMNNMAYVHALCRGTGLEYVYAASMPISNYDLTALIKSLDKGKESVKLRPKFEPLEQYFKQCTKPTVSLTFKQIEEIMGKPLCKSAYKFPFYWNNTTGEHCISTSWLINGYTIKNLYLNKRKIVLKRIGNAGLSVNIPEVFLNGKIPPDAKCELENYFSYIRNKYGI